MGRRSHEAVDVEILAAETAALSPPLQADREMIVRGMQKISWNSRQSPIPLSFIPLT